MLSLNLRKYIITNNIKFIYELVVFNMLIIDFSWSRSQKVFFFFEKENMGCYLGFKFRIFYNRLSVWIEFKFEF